MAQQNTGGFGVAHPVPYSPDGNRHVDVNIKDPVDHAPSDVQPPGVDEEVDYNSLEEALTS
tara:strand:+ start:330 stop:512 length:183 start_codon:yes stop_codon:yes gene_type:complete